MRVLVVDDRRDVALILQTLLAHAGHDVIVTSDGHSALAEAHRFHPHAIITDLALDERLDGYAVARAVRSDPAIPPTRLIALTGYDDDEHRSAAVEAGFDEYLVKPPALVELLAALPKIEP